MPSHETFASLNESYASSFDKGNLPLPPSKQLIVGMRAPPASVLLSYDDSLMHGCSLSTSRPASQLGINLGEAHVIRNAGGSAKDALRSIVISQRLLGTREIAVFHHTDCGMLTFTNEVIRDKVKSEAPGDATVAEAVDRIDFLTFPNLEESVKDDISFLKENPLVLKGTELSGWIYDVNTGKVSCRQARRLDLSVKESQLRAKDVALLS
ncbi:hypothetical protein CVT26_002683 [Gymnopilus dilepis]|uniref:Carbonic anhydrase n=1 Tax=Gymnopilus dilepis TaxID=231916 RepID=A0A409VDA3_9AGAR|nr:hypothetical protein CVT26_002683 [Gymnopilus dilepis]